MNESHPVAPTQRHTPVQAITSNTRNLIGIIMIIAIIAVILVALVFVFQGSEANRFIGIWVGAPQGETLATFQFQSDGILTISSNDQSYSGTYEITDGTLIMNVYGQKGICHYSFSNNDRALTITFVEPPGETAYLIRQ